MHCGCINLLIVFMFVLFSMLVSILLLLFISMMCLDSCYLYSLKVFTYVTGWDLDILFSVWNLLFMFLVLLITFSVLLFSFSYMSVYSVQNFMYLYLAFVFSMCWLILNNNFYWMMLGWDGLGVVSFLLIFYYKNYESNMNALFTLFQNRVGDLFFVLFLVLSWSYSLSFSVVLKYGIIVLIIGCMVKSAQYPFNSWLLAAMSAPTPISSLVHSSTLVVAGVYILLQYSYCLINYLNVLKMVSVLTLIYSLFGLMNEVDMKKLIAYSTMSHVGLMMFMLSLQLYKITYFHLNIHAMFKSLMFMCFGFVMLHSNHAQDFRLISYMNLHPMLKFSYYYACLCLMGLPFLTAFFSKDFMMEKLMEVTKELSDVSLLLLFLGVSVYYSLKLLMLFNKFVSYQLQESHVLGLSSVLLMIFVSTSMVNIYLSLVFSVSLEFMQMKMFIYLIMLSFIMIKLVTNLQYKWLSYEKSMFFQELFFMYWYQVDSYVYSVLYDCVVLMEKLFSFKLILLVNWWVVGLSVLLI